MNQIYFDQISGWQFYAYNGLCLIALVWMLWKYRGNIIPILVIMLFFSGMIDDLLGATGRNVLRMGLLTVCIWQSIKGGLNIFYSEYSKAFYVLCLYIIYFITASIFINHDNYLLAFSLLSKTLIPFFILTLMLKEQELNRGNSKDTFWLFEKLIIIQVLLSIIKMAVLGGFLEGWVGSMTGIRGGGAGTSFPLLGLMWLALKNDMNFTRRDTLIALGLLLLGFATGKRAVWILFPVFFVILSIYVYRKEILKKILLFIAIAPFLFYLTVRISPTFNPDNKVWGTFDAEYATDYVLEYSGGIDDNHTEIQSGVGRLGTVTWMIEQFSKKGKNFLTGRGNEYMTYAGIENYTNRAYYGGIVSRGSITGIVNTFFTLGLVGVIIYIVFISCMFCSNKSRFNTILFVVVLFDYIFYNAQILNSMPLLIFAIYLAYFSKTLSEAEDIETGEENTIDIH